MAENKAPAFKPSKTTMYVYEGKVGAEQMTLALPFRTIEGAAEAEREAAEKEGRAAAPWSAATPSFKFVRTQPIPRTDDELIAEAQAELDARKAAAASKAKDAMSKADAERAAKKATR